MTALRGGKLAALALSVAVSSVAACDRSGDNAPDTSAAAETRVSEKFGPTGAIKPPTPADVALRIGAGQKGGTFSLKVGQKLAVELIGVPSAGYVWDAAETPPFLDEIGGFSGPTSTDQLQEGYAGGNHWEVLVYRAHAAGTGVLKLAERRPFETEEPPRDEFSATIVATE